MRLRIIAREEELESQTLIAIYAAEKGQEAVVKLLFDKGADLVSKDSSYDQTLLPWASSLPVTYRLAS